MAPARRKTSRFTYSEGRQNNGVNTERAIRVF